MILTEIRGGVKGLALTVPLENAGDFGYYLSIRGVAGASSEQRRGSTSRGFE
jgi:hypothetical protein